MAELKDLSTTDANNNGSAANAGFPEGMAPSDVNNAARALEGMIARWYKDGNGTLTTGGSSNAYTLTPNRTISAYADGDTFLIEANHTNTGAATLNVSALGAKSIVTVGGSALGAGEITSGGRYFVSYDGTNFQLLGTPKDIAGLSVLGRAANTAGALAAITGTDGQVLRVSGTALGFGTIATAGIADDAVTYAKVQDVSATSRILGRATAGAGVIEELTGTQVGTIVGSATTSASGIVELATAAEIRTGTDTERPMTPGDFSNYKTLSEEGYYTLPGGLTFQWGRYSSNAASGNTAITFPVAFTTVYTVTATAQVDATTVQANQFWGVDTDNVATTGFSFFTNIALPDGFTWIAIGLKTS